MTVKPAKIETVLLAARHVFTRYGYRRTTMAAIADRAGISRPALYLLFSSKEDIFAAGLKQLLDSQLKRIGEDLSVQATNHDKLHSALGIWYVEPFEITITYPDAIDLWESSLSFADEVVRTMNASFEDVLTELIRQADGGRNDKLPAARRAHVLTSAVPGFKLYARTTDELRQMIDDLLLLIV